MSVSERPSGWRLPESKAQYARRSPIAETPEEVRSNGNRLTPEFMPDHLHGRRKASTDFGEPV
jgi:hypothetical protein